MGVPERHVGEPADVEVGPEVAVEHPQAVADELLGDAAGVVVGRDQPVGVLDQVGAEQQPVAGLAGVGERAEEGAPLLDVEVADGAAEERDQLAVVTRQVGQVEREVADDRLDGHAVVGRRDLLGGVAQRALARRRPARTGPGARRRANAPSSSRVLSLVPLPSSTRVVASHSAAISSACSRRIARSASVG